MKFKQVNGDNDVYLEMKAVAYGMAVFGRRENTNISYPLVVFHDHGAVEIRKDNMELLGLSIESR